ncbi:tubby-like protein [Artemisia annua]|uniref:Tubby-like protein n=1 Tax=Artemisia annua TaxID=35608 RepID=A0A2U1KKC8_ARTAN|nr:tubby-like protein [Artemisia annua]
MSLKTLIHYIKHKRLPVKDNGCTETSVVVNDTDSSCWGESPLELLRDVLMRVEESESTWPVRKNVVLAAGVCKRWRSVVKVIVSSRELKQPGTGCVGSIFWVVSVVVNDNDSSNSSCWDELPLELLRDVLMRIEVSESTWPVRENVVLVSGVCKRWRSVVKEIVNSREGSGTLTFPSELKQDTSVVVNDDNDSSSWCELPLELLRDVLMRVEVSEFTWPVRKNVVLAAGVCKRWRSVFKEIVCSREGSGMLTFPSELKQPGSVGSLTKCLIKRNRRTQTFKRYLILNEASNNDGVLRGKFLLAARRFRRAKCTDYIISLSAEDISEETSTYMGNSKFLGTKFTVYDSSAGSYPISSISYEVNAKGPRYKNSL